MAATDQPTYTSIQTVKDRQYLEAWESAPEEFKKQAEMAGLEPKVECGSGALEYDENYITASYEIIMHEEIDTFVDALVEKYGSEHERIVRLVSEDLKRPMELEIERNRALALGRILFYLVKSETRNMLACIHAAMHAIPRLAAANGMASMRESARECGVSPEWMRRCRNEVCQMLGIPIPDEGTKSVDAREKYAINGRRNHWRRQTTTKGIQCQNQPKVQSRKAAAKRRAKSVSSLLQAITKRSRSQKKAS